MSRVREVFCVDLPLHRLFECPTVAELSGSIEAAIKRGDGLETPPIEPVSHDGELPLSFAQQRLWFLDQLEPDNPFYNVPLAVRLGGPLDVAALGRTLSEIVRRHEVLRTTFSAVEGRAVQVIGPAREVRLDVEDLSRLGEQERETEAQKEAGEEARR